MSDRRRPADGSPARRIPGSQRSIPQPGLGPGAGPRNVSGAAAETGTDTAANAGSTKINGGERTPSNDFRTARAPASRPMPGLTPEPSASPLRIRPVGRSGLLPCPGCGYPLPPRPGKCPECGARVHVSREPRSRSRLAIRLRRASPVAVPLAVLLCFVFQAYGVLDERTARWGLSVLTLRDPFLALLSPWVIVPLVLTCLLLEADVLPDRRRRWIWLLLIAMLPGPIVLSEAWAGLEERRFRQATSKAATARTMIEQPRGEPFADRSLRFRPGGFYSVP